MDPDLAKLTVAGLAAQKNAAEAEKAKAKARPAPAPAPAPAPKFSKADWKEVRSNAAAPTKASLISKIEQYDKYFPEVKRLGGKYTIKNSVAELEAVLDVKRSHLQNEAAIQRGFSTYCSIIQATEAVALGAGVNVNGVADATAQSSEIERPLKMLIIDNGWGRMSPMWQLLAAQTQLFFLAWRVNNDPAFQEQMKTHMQEVPKDLHVPSDL